MRLTSSGLAWVAWTRHPLIHRDVFIQPLQWTPAAPAQAVVDFLLLLGDVDMHRAMAITGSQHFADLLWRDRSQRVKAQAQLLVGLLR